MKKWLSVALALLMVLSTTAVALAEDLPTIDQLKLGEDYKGITANLKFLSHRTDLQDTKLKEYAEKFHEFYPGITIEYETVTDYAQDALIRLTGGNWGDVMMVPADIDRDEYSKFFIPFGTLDALSPLYNFADSREFGGLVYGMPSTGNAQGIVYNKRIFADAGVTEIPKTPEAFIAALTAVKEKTDAIPLYTNYAAGWTMGAWDAYISGSATGDPDYMNRVLPHAKDPFADPGDGTHAYTVYKILYDAVANGLIEDDYTTTDWESSKVKLNSGEIACMVLGSWAFTQMVEAGPNGGDIGYMSFPISIGGKQYASADADYSYGISVEAPFDNQVAAMLYVKWLIHESGFTYSEGGIPIDKSGAYPDLYASFGDVEMVPNTPAVAGEETLLNELNAESTLAVNANGNTKVQQIIEHAANGDKSLDEIMTEWNTAWSDAQTALSVAVQ
jgi:ABC-type glycerol-3-phosphate transport system substrate-binding protein